MSQQYDQYLIDHKENVAKAFHWLKRNLPDLFEDGIDYEHQIVFNHDDSKTKPDEYYAYDAYFYGGNRSYEVLAEFDKAWLMHIHRNPHHWQHWVLLKDDPEKVDMKFIDIPDNYINEMISDWWSFSWANGELSSIFKWYDEHKDIIKVSHRTRKKIENILNRIKEILDQGGYL